MNVEQLRTWIAPVSQLIAVIVVAGTLVIWGLRLQDKVDRLEGQVQVLLTSPSDSLKSSQSDASSSASDTALPNACANLAEKAATAASSTVIPSSAIREIRSLMVDLGCMAKTQK
jgi:hypothetical protein